MSKAEINNEIVLMRKNVDQAKIHIVKKLTRDALKLRQKKGTDAQKAKNQRKAERLAAEILSIKKMKKDEITKYILMSTLNLKQILEDQHSTPLMRIMARIANHNKFSIKISEFKNKYPNYIEFLGPGRKKKAKLERKEKLKLKNNEIADDNDQSGNIKEEKENKVNNAEILDESDSESSDSESTENERQSDNGMVDSDNHEKEDDDEDNDEDGNEDEYKNKNENKSENEDEDKNEHTDSKQKNVENNVPVKSLKTKPIQKNHLKVKSKKKNDKIENNNIEHINLKKKNDTSKVISKQAIVKKFTDILKQESSNLNKDEEDKNEFTECNTIIEKEVDPFFITDDGGTNYLSVALPKNKSNFEEDDYDDNYTNNYSKRKFSRQQNDKFFSKVPKFSKDNTNFNTNADLKWNRQQRHVGSYDKERNRDRKDFKKFDSDYKDQPKSFNKHSKANFEQQNNEVLHPSWEAKKKQQEILKKGFQGKKIVFGDDM